MQAGIRVIDDVLRRRAGRKKQKSNFVERLHGHWSAWFDVEPQIAFGGAMAAEAVDRLVRF
jgi:hypothetical protein